MRRLLGPLLPNVLSRPSFNLSHVLTSSSGDKNNHMPAGPCRPIFTMSRSRASVHPNTRCCCAMDFRYTSTGSPFTPLNTGVVHCGSLSLSVGLYRGGATTFSLTRFGSGCLKLKSISGSAAALRSSACPSAILWVGVV